jgi:uncharacterized protein YciU (UPF0263 family)
MEVKIPGTIVASPTEAIFTNLKGNERKCAECMQPLEDGESVVMLSECKVINESISVISDPFFIHINNGCLEDFVARFLQSKSKDEDSKESPA